MRIVYLHGFLSSPASTKARAFSARLAGGKDTIAIPDLNQPDFRGLTISRVIRTAETLLDPKDPSIVIGSSMGGFAAAHLLALHPERVAAAVLMAPAFNMASLLEQRLGEAELERWQREGSAPVDHPAFERQQQLDYAFIEDARRWASRNMEIHSPTLVLHGRRDEDVPFHLSENFAAERPNVELVGYDAGHGLEEVIEDVLDRSLSFIEAAQDAR